MNSSDLGDEVFGNYDFGLSPEEEERAARLHREAIVIDMVHQGPCGHRFFTDELVKDSLARWEATRDVRATFMDLNTLPQRLAIKGEAAEYKDWWDHSGLTCGVFGAEPGSVAEFALATELFDSLPWLIKARTAGDVHRAKQEGKRAMYGYSQSVRPLTEDLDQIGIAHQFGLRMLQPTYNSLCLYGSGCTERTDSGVSKFGVRVIELANQLGIILDTSHCGLRTTLETCELVGRPVTACHTSASALYPHPRAKSDEELRAVAQTGGIIGLYAVPFFLASGSEVTIDTMLDHIDYVSELVGPDHVGIGTDWPMALPLWYLREVFPIFLAEIGFGPEHGIQPEQNLVGFDDMRDWPNVTRGLVKRGYKDEEIRGILGENLLRVFAEVCG